MASQPLAGTIIEEKYCVARCSPGKYRDVAVNDRMCIPCNGPCPKSKCPGGDCHTAGHLACVLQEPINALNIRLLVNCSEIEGNIELLSHVFEDHLPDSATSL